jgi:hypothetical protein
MQELLAQVASLNVKEHQTKTSCHNLPAHVYDHLNAIQPPTLPSRRSTLLRADLRLVQSAPAQKISGRYMCSDIATKEIPFLPKIREVNQTTWYRNLFCTLLAMPPLL